MTEETKELPEVESDLEQCLLKALEAPSSKSIELFYQTFLKASLFVPRRFQEKQISNLAAFPSPFLDVLAVSAEDENYVPVFTSLSEMTDWTNEELEYLRITGEEVCKRTPDDWWLTLNPAGDFGKELSPWEVKRLRSGTAAMDELVVEQLRGEDPSITFEPLGEETLERVKDSLEKLLESTPEITSVYIGVHTTEETPERYIAGVLHTSVEDLDSFQDGIESEIARLFIGDIPIEVHFGASLEESPSLALFRFTKPIVERASTSTPKMLLARLRNFLKPAT